MFFSYSFYSIAVSCECLKWCISVQLFCCFLNLVLILFDIFIYIVYKSKCIIKVYLDIIIHFAYVYTKFCLLLSCTHYGLGCPHGTLSISPNCCSHLRSMARAWWHCTVESRIMSHHFLSLKPVIMRWVLKWQSCKLFIY